jgi:hypothetical protein
VTASVDYGVNAGKGVQPVSKVRVELLVQRVASALGDLLASRVSPASLGSRGREVSAATQVHLVHLVNVDLWVLVDYTELRVNGDLPDRGVRPVTTALTVRTVRMERTAQPDLPVQPVRLVHPAKTANRWSDLKVNLAKRVMWAMKDLRVHKASQVLQVLRVLLELKDLQELLDRKDREVRKARTVHLDRRVLPARLDRRHTRSTLIRYRTKRFR